MSKAMYGETALASSSSGDGEDEFPLVDNHGNYRPKGHLFSAEQHLPRRCPLCAHQGQQNVYLPTYESLPRWILIRKSDDRGRLFCRR
jgi:hypothetical protein